MARSSPPQLKSSPVVSTQPPLQLVRPGSQAATQVPAWQALPLGHTLSHPPQFLGSARVLAQPPLQLVSGARQAHEAPWHTVRLEQAKSQRPQLA